MAAKDKEIKTFEKLKQFFRAAKTAPVNYKGKSEFVLTPELEKEIGPESPVQQRIKAIRELCEVVVANRLEEYGVERLWAQVKDLLEKGSVVEIEHRHAVIHLVRCLVQGQYDRLDLMRVHFFQLIKRHNIPEDVSPLFDVLCVLTHEGRNIQQLEDELGGFLAEWLPAVAGAGRIVEFLDVLVNLIKCNAAYVDDPHIVNIVQYSCFICCWSQDRAAVDNSLNVLGTIVCYSELPGEALQDFAAALCRKVNTTELTLTCWNVMRNLLGTHMGHATLLTLCKFLQDRGSHSDRSLLRGAVFFINMGLWSDKRVQTLKCTPTSVLPSLLQALECGQALVVYEVAHSVHRLVVSCGLELQHPAWDIVLDILQAVAAHLDAADTAKANGNEPGDDLARVGAKLHETLTGIEQLIELGQFNGSVRRVFQLVELTSRVRPESSVLRLITYLARSIRPTRLEWLAKLDSLVDRYYRQETRPNIRIKVVEVVAAVLTRFRYVYEEELVERVVLPYFALVHTEPELCVRNAVAQLLLALCQESDSKKCLDVLNVLERLVNRPFELSTPVLATEGDILDVKTVASGLIQALFVKMHVTPACHAVRMYRILVGHLEYHYTQPKLLNFHHGVHVMIFEMLLKLRVNRLGHVGLEEASGTRFSPYLTLDTGSTVAPGSAPPSPAPTPFSLASASMVMIQALRVEKDWRIIEILLAQLPTVMQNKALIAGKCGADVGFLADALCSMVSDKNLNLPDSLKNAPTKLTRTEFQSGVFPVIAAVAAYHTYLEPSQQARCIKCLEVGLASRCASQCVLAITTCTLEMRDAMYRLLPEVLLNLSKISATVVIAIPILEFLSTLTSLPHVFASFVGDQYMSVFAIALPYTNPFKYDHYTVSLAHHVIAVWFLKCRLPFRRDFVRFITANVKVNVMALRDQIKQSTQDQKGLKANVIVPFEETSKAELAALNEDSTSRKRSSSLTEQGSRRRERPVPNARLAQEMRPPMDEALMHFHVELTETCIDLMARYAFSSCAARATRSPMAVSLLIGGQSQMWLLGHKLITVTTSGCSQKPHKNNLCDRCWMSCRLDTDLPSPKPEPKEGGLDETKLTGDPQMHRLIFGSGLEDAKASRDVCACWCQGWAEIHIRRPTGEISWMMRLENETPVPPPSPSFNSSSDPLPLTDLSALFAPFQRYMPLPSAPSAAPPPDQPTSADESTEAPKDPPGILTISTAPPLELAPVPPAPTAPLPPQTLNAPPTVQPAPAVPSHPVSVPVSIPGSPTSRHDSRENLDGETDFDDEDCGDDDDDDENISVCYPKVFLPAPIGGKARNPVRRSNSSPEMSASWKHPFLKDKGTGAHTHEDAMARVSCEAIPEEMTPPDAHVVALGPGASDQALHLDVGLSVDVAGRSERGPATVAALESTDVHSALPTATFTRDRSRTISVMSPARKPRYEDIRAKPHSPRSKEAQRSGVSPAFVFLQLFHSAHFGATDEKPLLVDMEEPIIKRAVTTLDFIPPFETHKVGVVYVGPGQSNEVDILRNEFGSLRYALFLQSLGTLINLEHADHRTIFLGGLDKKGTDGKFAYIWQDDVTQVTFHVATLMPNKDSDPTCTAKIMHIGNDYVTIVYNESGEDHNFVKLGQFNYASVVIQPLDMGSNKVTIKARDELAEHFGHGEQKIVSDENLAILARQLALHANLASEVYRSLKTKNRDPYASNWLERLRKIKRLRIKVLEVNKKKLEQAAHRPLKRPDPHDFTVFT